ncbi:MAG: ABC transporter permease subunit [Gammaproteobacteria bacterium]
MDSHPDGGVARRGGEAQRFQSRRRTTDQIVRRVITFGGFVVLAAMLLILAYLAWVVAPLFSSATGDGRALGERPAWSEYTVRYLGVDPRGELGLRIDAAGSAEFFRLDDLSTLEKRDLRSGDSGGVAAVASDPDAPARLLLAFDDGALVMLQQRYGTRPDDEGVLRVQPELEPVQGQALPPLRQTPVVRLAYADAGDAFAVAALSPAGVEVLRVEARENFLTGEVAAEASRSFRELPFAATAIALDGKLRWLYAGDDEGRIHVFRLPRLEPSGVVTLGEAPVTALSMLLGGTSLLAGDGAGAITQLFPVRGDEGDAALTPVRTIRTHGAAIEQILPEHRRRGFAAIDADGVVGVHYSTSGRTLLLEDSGFPAVAGVAFTPGADGLLLAAPDGRACWLTIDNPHPEISLRTLWEKVWYENYPEPGYTWQSTAATRDFEPKLSLTPLVFGTLKAALYALAFAVPIALLAAMYSAYFMAAPLRRRIKPTIELMAALPTVILGFLAGLWLAPLIEQRLAGLFLMLLLVPLGVVAFAWGWSRLPSRLRRHLPYGWTPLLLLPVILILGWFSFLLAEPLQYLVFGAPLRDWLSQEAGISYEQRNAIVVGIAMGFAVIPSIFSIAEDALHAVPRSLANGSMALGATRWQTLVRVVLPTASPGIFSALMIGLGRAVGETMIVLMATGNTPIMDWNLFEGMRTLAANIAIEMPESEVHSTHYRVLFLSALVLFVFTFIVNTGAEVVRQRLRNRYSSL